MLKGIQLAQRRQPTMVHDVIISLNLLKGGGVLNCTIVHISFSKIWPKDKLNHVALQTKPKASIFVYINRPQKSNTRKITNFSIFEEFFLREIFKIQTEKVNLD